MDTFLGSSIILIFALFEFQVKAQNSFLSPFFDEDSNPTRYQKPYELDDYSESSYSSEYGNEIIDEPDFESSEIDSPSASESFMQTALDLISSSESLLQLYDLQSAPGDAIQNYFDISKEFLTRANFPTPEIQASRIARVVKQAFNDLDAPSHARVITKTVGEFLEENGVLTTDNAPALAEQYIDAIRYAISGITSDPEGALYRAGTNGLINFLTGLGVSTFNPNNLANSFINQILSLART